MRRPAARFLKVTVRAAAKPPCQLAEELVVGVPLKGVPCLI
jgi:hypothetical protein